MWDAQKSSHFMLIFCSFIFYTCSVVHRIKGFIKTTNVKVGSWLINSQRNTATRWILKFLIMTAQHCACFLYEI